MKEITIIKNLAQPKIIKTKRFGQPGRSAVSLKRIFGNVMCEATHVLIMLGSTPSLDVLLPVRKSDLRVETTSVTDSNIWEQDFHRLLIAPVAVTTRKRNLLELLWALFGRN